MLLLLYANTRSMIKTLIVVLAVPFSAIGAFWFLYLLGYNMSIAVWVGLIALLGRGCRDRRVHAALSRPRLRSGPAGGTNAQSRRTCGRRFSHGAVKRIRPKFMTVATMLFGLVPIMWATGTGADVMKRIAAPMIGGIFTSFLLELVVYPAVYEIWKSRSIQRGAA